jgi:hypothetical protein
MLRPNLTNFQIKMMAVAPNSTKMVQLVLYISLKKDGKRRQRSMLFGNI